MTNFRARKLEGKRAVITGGTNGIGRAITDAFLREGASVLATYNTDKEAASELQESAGRLGGTLRTLSIDLAHAGNVEVLYREALQFHQAIDILVNNVAVITRTCFLDITAEQYNRVLGVNLTFPFFATQRFARHMREHQIQGSIINISSISAFKAISAMAHYQCSKAGLSMLTKSAAFELAPYGIRVNTISPGLTATKGNREQWDQNPDLWRTRGKDIPLGRTGLPTDHAEAAVFLASSASSWITGADLVIDGGEAVI